MTDAARIADTGLFVACGRRDNEKYTALSRFARRHGISFRIPRTVPIAGPINEGRVEVVDLDYTDRAVSTVMDDARRFIANASNRNEDEIETADTALAGVAVQLLSTGEADTVRIVTTDHDDGEATVAVLESHGFEEQVEWRDGFDLLDRLT